MELSTLNTVISQSLIRLPTTRCLLGFTLEQQRTDSLIITACLSPPLIAIMTRLAVTVLKIVQVPGGTILVLIQILTPRMGTMVIISIGVTFWRAK